MAPTETLSRKIRWIFIVQGLIASLLVTLGTLYGSLMLRDILLKQRIVDEAQRTWEQVEADPQAPLPQSNSYAQFFVPVGSMPDRVPPALRALPPGFHRMPGNARGFAYVSERAKGTLYLNIAPGLTDHVVRWISLLAVVLSVSGIAFISWLGYRRCKRIVAPVAQLTDTVLAWDPRSPQLTRFDSPDLRGENTFEVAHLGDALASMSRRVEEYIERERNFTRDASHELRTPVTVARVAGDLLATENLSARGERSLRRLRQATDDMEILIDAFLVLARHPDVPVDSEDVSVQEVVHEEAANAREWLEGKPVNLVVLPTADPQIHSPPRVIGVIVSQLLRNACHFTDEGSVQIEVLGDRVEIRDTGIGMDEETMAKAFDPFWRADLSNYTAKGMGLTLAQRLAERFGWKVLLESQPGQGTLATLRFS